MLGVDCAELRYVAVRARDATGKSRATGWHVTGPRASPRPRASALCPICDRSLAAMQNVAMCQNPTYAVQQIWRLLDHVVGESEQRRRQFNAESICHFAIDHELEFDWLLHRKIRRVGAFKNTVNVVCRAAEDIDIIRSVR